MKKRDELFPEVFEPNGQDRLSKKGSLYYPVIKKCLMNILENRSVVHIIQKLRASRIVLYAVNEFVPYLLNDIESHGAGIEVIYICDHNHSNYENEFMGVPVNGIDRLKEDYQANMIDKVIICNLSYANEIIENLISIGISLEDIITVDSLVFAI